LCEFSGRFRLVRDFADYGDQDVLKGRLGVNIQDSNLAVLEIEFLDPFADGLGRENQRKVGQIELSAKLFDADQSLLTFWPTATGTFSASTPETNWDL
jgi:hypothetical protein